MDYDTISAPDQKCIRVYAQQAYTSLQALQETFLLTDIVVRRKIPGVFVECGTCQGVNAGVMARLLSTSGRKDAAIHLFDSFEGIPLAGPNDPQQPGMAPGVFVKDRELPIEERLVSSGLSIASVDQVKANMKRWGFEGMNISYHEGWFQNTLPGAHRDIYEIALLRLDGDLYESTECCLKWLYPMVAPGGCIIIDDYGTCSGAKRALHDYFDDHDLAVDLTVETDIRSAYWFKKQL